MTAILDALATLGQSLDKLETAAATAMEREKERERKAQRLQQHDLFSGQAQRKTNTARVPADTAAAAKKLDVMIERVEKILAER